MEGDEERRERRSGDNHAAPQRARTQVEAKRTVSIAPVRTTTPVEGRPASRSVSGLPGSAVSTAAAAAAAAAAPAARRPPTTERVESGARRPQVPTPVESGTRSGGPPTRPGSATGAGRPGSGAGIVRPPSALRRLESALASRPGSSQSQSRRSPSPKNATFAPGVSQLEAPTAEAPTQTSGTAAMSRPFLPDPEASADSMPSPGRAGGGDGGPPSSQFLSRTTSMSSSVYLPRDTKSNPRPTATRGEPVYFRSSSIFSKVEAETSFVERYPGNRTGSPETGVARRLPSARAWKRDLELPNDDQ